MLYKIHNLILIIFILNIFQSCNAKDKKRLPIYSKKVNAKKIEKSDDNLPFDSLLRRVNNRINGIWDPPIRMYGDKDFMIIYDNSDKYY
ncbi:hypothetical protein DBR11_12370, partial [Pedobacter sp. HMWF019]